MKKVEFSAAEYDYTKTYPDIDYSERITESGLVLSMREIYNRYAAMGVDVLNGDYVDDDDDPDRTEIEEFDDPLDVLQRSNELQSREIPSRKKKDRVSVKPAADTLDDAGVDDTPLSPSGAGAPKGRQRETTPRSQRQSVAKQNDGADDQE